MVEWITSNPFCQKILDPAVGLGIFLRAVLDSPNSDKYELLGYDIDSIVLCTARSLFSKFDYTNVELLNKDYMFNDWNNRYDGIVCNPPYLKFHQYKSRGASLQEFQTRLGMTLSGLTNIYTMFLLKSANQLTPEGRASYIVPLEFLNADYGTKIKKYLLKSKTLRYVVIFDSSSNLFSNAITTSCILLFANDEHSHAITFVNVNAVDELSDLASKLNNYPNIKATGKTVPYADLDPDVKWLAYYQKRNGSKYKNLVPLSTYGKIVRGIATGDNDYFTFDEKKKKEFHIPDKFLLPCITKATQADSYFFTKEDFDDLRIKSKRVFLLNATDTTHPAVREYIELGEKLEVNTRYLTSHRTPWFIIENRPPAPILVTVFNRNGLRFVRNEANVRNLTCFHSFYVNMLAMHQLELLMAYLLTDVSREILNDNRREYGGGLKKFEPNDLNKANVIDLEVIDTKTGTMIIEMYQRYRLSVVQHRPDASQLEKLNDIFFQLMIT